MVDSNAIVISGNIAFCRQGACSGTASVCNAGRCAIADGGPINLAEFTLSRAGADFYDVSIINGVNVPMAMGPLSPPSTSTSPYNCGSAGATVETLGRRWRWHPWVWGLCAGQVRLSRGVGCA